MKNNGKELFNFNKFVKAVEALKEYQDWNDYFLIVLSPVDFNYEGKQAQQFCCIYCPHDIINLLCCKIIVHHSANTVEPLLCVLDSVKHGTKSDIK